MALQKAGSWPVHCRQGNRTRKVTGHAMQSRGGALRSGEWLNPCSSGPYKKLDRWPVHCLSQDLPGFVPGFVPCIACPGICPVPRFVLSRDLSRDLPMALAGQARRWPPWGKPAGPLSKPMRLAVERGGHPGSQNRNPHPKTRRSKAGWVGSQSREELLTPCIVTPYKTWTLARALPVP